MADFFLLLLCSFLWPCLTVSIALGSLNTSNSIRDGDTLVSPGGVFELGFFTPGSSSRRYLGIWYSNSVTSVPWVANREVPLNDTSGVVEVTDQGILVLLDGNRSIVWSSNASRPVRSPVVQLLDSGNLVVKDELDRNPGNFIWQSFDYSGNTFLAGMKIGRDFRAGLDRYLSSWKAPDDPSVGKFTYRGVLSSENGAIVPFSWIDSDRGWIQNLPLYVDNCDKYALCGANGICDNNMSPVCSCMPGFVPSSLSEWEATPGTGCCVRKTELNCTGPTGDCGFIQVSAVKIKTGSEETEHDPMRTEQ
ncbi:hypothetical protein V6N11_030709 [Hibiscus sabdariffa]|uniref:Bulb-type lectin domain-containing protein n=1 Tax=Hibiscus sabdariffa TaxID=183260 RepID=A0ABR2NBI7_9ROSI